MLMVIMGLEEGQRIKGGGGKGGGSEGVGVCECMCVVLGGGRMSFFAGTCDALAIVVCCWYPPLLERWTVCGKLMFSQTAAEFMPFDG